MSGGEPILVRDGGEDPEFDHTGSRIYFRDVRNSNYTLASVGVPAAATLVPGRDEIEHVRSPNATQYAIAPNGEWIAFEERFKTFIAPFPRTGRPIDIGPTAQAYPVQRVSRDAGFFLHWSGDSRRLYWTLGPELFTRDLGHTFSFVEGGQAKADEAEAKGIPIGFTARSDKPSGVIALVGARVVTMAGLKPGPIAGTPGVIENATVLIEGNRITAVGTPSSVGVPSGATARRSRREDDHPRPRGCPRACRWRVERAAGRVELASRGQRRVRRHHVARSIERHRDRFHECGVDPVRRQARTAALLDRHDPLRRGNTVQGGDRLVRRCVVARPAAESGRSNLGQELQPAAARRPADADQGVPRAAR